MIPLDIKLGIVEGALAGDLPTVIAARLQCTTDVVADVLRIHGGSAAKLRAARDMLRRAAAEESPRGDELHELVTRARKAGTPQLARLADRLVELVATLNAALADHAETQLRRKRIAELEAELARLRERASPSLLCDECGHKSPSAKGLAHHRTRSHKPQAAAS